MLVIIGIALLHAVACNGDAADAHARAPQGPHPPTGQRAWDPGALKVRGLLCHDGMLHPLLFTDTQAAVAPRVTVTDATGAPSPWRRQAAAQ
jgi:hypothetical protein